MKIESRTEQIADTRGMVRQCLYALPGAGIGYFRCPNAQDGFEQKCTVPSDQLVFPDYPVSVRRQDRRSHLAGPAAIGWYQKGEQYRRQRIGRYDDAHTWISIHDPEALGFRISNDDWPRVRRHDPPRPRYAFNSISPYLYAKVRILRHLLRTAAAEDELEVEERVAEILSQAFEACRVGEDGSSHSGPIGDDSLSESVKRLILDRLEEKITLGRLSEHFGISKFKISRQFKYETGETVYGYRNRVRLAMAVELLVGTDLSSAEIAFRLGFAGPSHFGYAFRRQYGCSPNNARAGPFPWALRGGAPPAGPHERA